VHEVRLQRALVHHVAVELIAAQGAERHRALARVLVRFFSAAIFGRPQKACLHKKLPPQFKSFKTTWRKWRKGTIA